VSTRDLFDAYADRYDLWYVKHADLYASELRAASAFDCRGGVEIGVGTGRFALPLGLRAGVDPSIAMLRLAPKDLDLVAAVGERLPFRAGAFPCALIVVTLCFADDPARLVEEAAHVAGKIVVCVVPRNSPWGIRYTREAVEGHPIYSRARFYAVSEVVEFGARLGMRLRRISATLGGDAEREYPVDSPDLSAAERYGFVCIELEKAYN
jgi:SAM-dependent methyltransferase